MTREPPSNSRSLDSRIRNLGLPSPGPVPTLPLPHQIAQKLHACTLPDADGWVNDRVHDLVDLQQAMSVYTGTLGERRDVATRLFTYRQRHPWPPLVTPRAGWDTRYATEAEGLDVAQTDEAVRWSNELIARIDNVGSPTDPS